ncbi:flagellin [Cognatiyoonia sp. IB215182]|uniref:flagellin N-terminal helical domain-containing protein n=1 Tax=Cognatiyoonia sp. IB215182 TaxID=3097353 RepID=UPI002A13AC6F|nr:flagellin [Cognatiyoonia sp. IB215182]MDX8352862.1 flagellin [Cognatiyoonia sp. IB215182]
MSSILTNNSAMVALQTLKSINMDLAKTQSMISTGKEVGSARDNSAVWAISKVMESDVKGFKAISESLSLGSSSVAVARNGAETVTDLLNDMKEKIVAAQGENVDRTKLQADVDAIADQISSVVGAAQFNGLNMLNGTESVNVLSSLDRAGDGTVSSANITVARQDLSFDAGVYGTGADLSANVTTTLGGNLAADGTGDAFSNGANVLEATVAGTLTAGETYNFQIAGETVSFTTTTTAVNDLAAGLTAAINAAGIEDISATVAGAVISINSTSQFDAVEVNTSGTGSGTFALQANGNTAAAATTNTQTITARASELAFSTTAGVNEGDGYRATIGGVSYDYIAGPNETFEDVARGLKTVIDGAGIENIETRVRQDATTGAWVLQIDNDGAAQTLTDAGAAGGTATGGLVGLDNLDVTSDEGVAAALANIETYIDTTIDAAAEFGSSQGRIDTQAEFISNLTDSLKSGIGALVDADMEEASARLQALQVQQQLGVQSLSIANQAPQTILSLFR